MPKKATKKKTKSAKKRSSKSATKIAKTSSKVASNEYVSDTTIKDSYAKGWQLLKKNFWLIVIAIFLVTVIEGVFRTIVENILPIFLASNIFLAIIIPTLIGIAGGIFFIGPLRVGGAWFFLRASRNERFEIEDMFYPFKKNYRDAVLVSFFNGLFALIGFILLIIPGIIVGIRLSFSTYLVMDKNMGYWDAIKTSWNMTKPYAWRLFGFGLIGIPIVLAGLLLLIVGIFPAIGWLSGAHAIFYNSVLAQK